MSDWHRSDTRCGASQLNVARRRGVDTLIVFFSCHASRSQLALADESLHLRDLAEAIVHVRAQRTLIIVDACYAASLSSFWKSGAELIGQVEDFDWPTMLAACAPGVRLMFSCASGEESYENRRRRSGAFAGTLMHAMMTAPGTVSTATPRYLVGAQEAFDFAQELMVADGFHRLQTPEGWSLGRFPLALGRVGNAAVERVSQASPTQAHAEIETTGRCGRPIWVRGRFVDARGVVVSQPELLQLMPDDDLWTTTVIVPLPVQPPGFEVLRLIVDLFDEDGRQIASGIGYVRPARLSDVVLAFALAG